MSFWPFTNTFNNNTQLQKFLDEVQDYSQVTVGQILDDIDLSQELVNELHSIKGNYNNASNFQFSQQLQQQQTSSSNGGLLPLSDVNPNANTNNDGNTHNNFNATTNNTNFTSNNNANTNANSNANNSNVLSNQVTIQIDNDSNSITSSNTDFNNNSKDPRGIKLIEILIQPHILNGLLDYIVKSVEFFHDLQQQENQELEKILNTSNDEIEIEANEHLKNGELENSKQTDDGGNDIHNNTKFSQFDDDEADDDENEDDGGGEESYEEKMRRCIQLAADILSIDLWIISNRILETPSIINKLWSILYLDNLNESSPSVTHLVHILDQLMDTNSIELLNFIRSRKDLVDTFVSKLEVPMLMDFFLRIIQSDKPDKPTGIIETLYYQDLIPKLIDILKPDPSQFQASHSRIPNDELFFKQTAATDFIKALITISSNTALAVVIEANIGPNQLTRQLVSKDIVNQMVNEIMLYTIEDKKNNIRLTNKHGINNCVGIIIELIRKNNSDYDLNCGSYSSLLPNHNGEATEVNSYVMFQWLKDFEQNTPGPRDPVFLGDMLLIFSQNLEKFNQLLDLEPELPSKVNKEAKILGFTKFRISELIAELLHCSNMILINSNKIKKIVHIRDKIRDRQIERLKNALNDNIDFEDPKNLSREFDEVTLDDIIESNNVINNVDQKRNNVPNSGARKQSTDEIFENLINGENDDFDKLIDSLEIDEDSDSEEPTISAENPFVCKDRDELIRANPSIGDYLKIKLIDSKILINIVSKFTEYSWHNFFHNVVFDLIQQIFNGKLNSYNSFLIANLFKNDGYNLTDVIVRAYKTDYDIRPGYLGHLILISEEVVKFTSLYKPDLISPLIVDSINSDDWNWFVTEILLKTREVYNVVLGADQNDGNDDDDDDDDDDDLRHHITPQLSHKNITNLNDKKGQDKFGFDSDTVGQLDMDSSYNRKSRLSIDGVLQEEDEEDDDDDNMPSMESVRIQDMSPKPEELQDDILSDDYDEEVGDFSHEGFQENLSESSSSDDEENQIEHDNKLTRVKKHHG